MPASPRSTSAVGSLSSPAPAAASVGASPTGSPRRAPPWSSTGSTRRGSTGPAPSSPNATAATRSTLAVRHHRRGSGQRGRRRRRGRRRPDRRPGQQRRHPAPGPMLDLDVADWRRVVEQQPHQRASSSAGPWPAAWWNAAEARSSTSLASSRDWPARPSPPYAASKGGLREPHAAMARRVGRRDIQANSVAPGYIHTEMTQSLVDDAAFNAWVIAAPRRGRWGSSADLVGPPSGSRRRRRTTSTGRRSSSTAA